MSQAAAKQPVVEEPMSDEDLFAQELARRTGKHSEEGAAQEAEDGRQEEPPVVEQEEEEGTGEEGRGEAAVPAQEEAQGDEPPQAKPDPAQNARQAQQPEWLAELPEEQQQFFARQSEELQKVKEQYTAVHGRLAPAQQENQRLWQRLQTMEAQLRSQAPAEDSRKGGQPSPAATPETDLQDSKEFAEFAEAFPDEARAIEALFGAKTKQLDQLRDQVERLSQGFTQVQERVSSQSRNEELAQLEAAHPDWQDVRFSTDFEDWRHFQPPAVQQLVDSPHAADCSYVLNLYKQACYLRDLATQEQAPATQERQPNRAAQQAQSRRQVRRNAPPSPPPSRGGVGVPGGNPGVIMSDEDIFAAELARRQRSRSQNS